MNSKMNVWNVVRYSTVILMLLCVSKGIRAQCPKEIICDPSRGGLGLRYDVLPSNVNATNTYLDFGIGDSRNGYYTGGVYPNDPDPLVKNTIYYEVSCAAGFGNLTIRFNDANHTFCGMTNGCRDYVFYQGGDYFRSVLDPYFQNTIPAGCKQWEGDCGTNGTVYRSGSLSIGTTYTNPNYLLAVSGKIMTEQYKVQPCGNRANASKCCWKKEHNIRLSLSKE